MNVEGDTFFGPAIPVRILPTDAPGLVRLCHPLNSDRFLSVFDRETTSAPHYIDPNTERSEVGFHGNGNTIDAVFSFPKFEPMANGRELESLVGGIGVAIVSGLKAGPLLEILRDGALQPELAEAIIRSLPFEELNELSRLLLWKPTELSLLRRCLRNDNWLREHFSKLAKWDRFRHETVPKLSSEVADEAPLLPTTGSHPASVGMILNSLGRRNTLPRRSACILATARNEGAYLLDWIAYHLSIGFEHVFLYSNNNIDGSDDLLNLLAQNGVITWIQNNPGQLLGSQDKAYAHALTMLPSILDYRWAAIIDIDEYIVLDFDIFPSIQHFLAIHETVHSDAIALSWAMFVASPNDTWSRASTLTRFTRRMREIDPHVKSIVRPRLFWSSTPHHPETALHLPFDFRNAIGELHHHPGVVNRSRSFASSPISEQAWVNHYFLRSADEALWKWTRGRANLAEVSGGFPFLDYLSNWFLQMHLPQNSIEDTRIMPRLPSKDAMLSRLQSLPGVMACDRYIQDNFSTQLRSNRIRFLSSAPFPEETEAIRQFRHVLASHN